MKTKTILIISLIMVVVLSGVLAYGIERIKYENVLASTLTNQSDQIVSANDLARSIKDARAKSADKLAFLDNLSLKEQELVPFIELIEDTGKALGLKVDVASVSADPVKPAANASSTGFKDPQPIHISIRTDGSWSGSLGFVHALENLPQKVDIESASMNINAAPVEGSSTPASSRWHTDSTVTVYIFND